MFKYVQLLVLFTASVTPAVTKCTFFHLCRVEKSEIDVAGGLFVLFGSGKWINIWWTVLHTLNFVSPWKTCDFS
jgi:hypothetical protein